MFLTKKVLDYQICINYYNKTHCSFVKFRKLFQRLFFKYFHKLKKTTDTIQFQRTYFQKKAFLFD